MTLQENEDRKLAIAICYALIDALHFLVTPVFVVEKSDTGTDERIRRL